MKKIIITTLAIILMAFGGYAQDKAYFYIRKNVPGSINMVQINHIEIGSLNKGIIKVEVEPGQYFIETTWTYINNAQTSQKQNNSGGLVGLLVGGNKQPTSHEVTVKASKQISAQSGGKYYILLTGRKIELEEGKESKYDAKYINEVDFAFLKQMNDDDKKVIIENVNEQFQHAIVENTAPKTLEITSDVDENIPQSNATSDNTYVLIIANEEYEQLDNVNFAIHDGEIFNEYCIKTLGIPEEQVRYCPNATFGKITGGIDWLKFALNNFEGSRGIVYYCGHGIPDEKSGEAFIVPVDGNGTNTTTCYSLNTLYKTLSETKAANVTYFMDACFTGANKEGSMLVAARGVAREPAKATIGGNSVVFSASSGDETAMTYPEKGHGLFTYFLLKKLQETNGEVSYLDLYNYINTNVKKKSFLVNEKPQTPVTATSPAAQNSWRDMKLK